MSNKPLRVTIPEWELLSSSFMCYLLLIKLHKVVLTFNFMDETLVCDHSNESFWQNFHLVLFITRPNVQMKAIESTFMWYCNLLRFTRCMVLPQFKSADETLVYSHSNESYWAVLSWRPGSGMLPEMFCGRELFVSWNSFRSMTPYFRTEPTIHTLLQTYEISAHL